MLKHTLRVSDLSLATCTTDPEGLPEGQPEGGDDGGTSVLETTATHVRQLRYEEGKRNRPFRESDGKSHDKLRIERSLRTVERKEGS